jgi:hypothetical protein
MPTLVIIASMIYADAVAFSEIRPTRERSIFENTIENIFGLRRRKLIWTEKSSCIAIGEDKSHGIPRGSVSRPRYATDHAFWLNFIWVKVRYWNIIKEELPVVCVTVFIHQSIMDVGVFILGSSDHQVAYLLPLLHVLSSLNGDRADLLFNGAAEKRTGFGLKH